MDAIIGLFGLITAFWGGWYARGVRIERYDAALADRLGQTELGLVNLLDDVDVLAVHVAELRS